MQYKWIALTVTTVGVLMSGIDTRIVFIGLPRVASALGADAEQAIWFTQSYDLGVTVALLIIGRISDMFGRVRVYSLGFAVFTIGSAITSLSMSPSQVIFFRLVQGLGAAILVANSAAIITDATPANELGFSVGLNQVAFRFGAMAGLTLSGLILSVLDWRALFYINIPIGIFGTIWSRRRLKEISIPERHVEMDWFGFGTFTASISCILLAITFAAYGLAELSLVEILLVIGILTLTIFVFQERRIPNPLLDLRLLRIRVFTGGVIAHFLNTVAWGAVVLLLSLYLQLVQGFSPLQSGLAILPIEFGFLAAGPISGRLSDKFGHILFTTSGLVVFSLSLVLLSTADVHTGYSVLATYIFLAGAGLGLFASPNMSSIMGSVQPQRRGIASAFRATMHNSGFALSINLTILIMTLSVPYSLVTSMISSPNPLALTESDRILFADGIKQTYLWLALINIMAIVPSILRGRRAKVLS